MATSLAPSPTPAVEAPPDPRRWWVLAVMSVGTLLVFLDDTVVNTALPDISVALDASTSALQWVVDAYVVVLASLLLLFGSIGDRFGRKRTMTAGLLVFGAGALLAIAASSTGVLIAARAVQGLGAAMVLPATLSILMSVFPPAERPVAIGIWTAVGGVGAGIGPVLGGWLVDRADWAAAFYLFLPLVLAGLAGMALVPESRSEGRVGFDVPGAVVGTAAVATLVYGIIHGGEVGFGETSVLATLALATVLLAAFALVERHVADPMLRLDLLRNREMTGGLLLIGVALFAIFVTFFSLTQYFQLVQGRSAFAAGGITVAAPIGLIIGSGLSGKLVGRVGPRALAGAMTALGTIALGLLTWITVGSDALPIAGALWLLGFGGGLGLPTLTGTVMAAVPDRDAGVGSALNDVSRQLGGALGIAVIGSIVNHLYRGDLESARPDGVPLAAVEAAGESIGIAGQVAASLPAPAAEALLRTVNGAYVDAMTRGFAWSAATMALGFVVAMVMLPRGRGGPGGPR